MNLTKTLTRLLMGAAGLLAALPAVSGRETVATEHGHEWSTWLLFQAHERKAFQGRALAIGPATGDGTITLTATADGLPSATLTLTGTR